MYIKIITFSYKKKYFYIITQKHLLLLLLLVLLLLSCSYGAGHLVVRVRFCTYRGYKSDFV